MAPSSRFPSLFVPFRYHIVFIILSSLIGSSRITCGDAFGIFPPTTSRVAKPTVAAAEAAAAKGFGDAKKHTKQKKKSQPSSSAGSSRSPSLVSSPQKVLKTLETMYGGTSPTQIAQGTERMIERSLQSQPPHVQLAIQLYRQLPTLRGPNQTDRPNTTLTSGEERLDGTQPIQMELNQLLQEHNLTERDLHNLLQKATWDASAYAKAARALTGEMPIDTQRKVQRGCDLLFEYASQAAASASMLQGNDEDESAEPQSDEKNSLTVLDVGCGFGVLVPFLKKAGFTSSQIHGLDLSPEMIHHAQETMMHQYRDNPSSVTGDSTLLSPTFTAGDFLSYHTASSSKKGSYHHGLIFCSSLHDMPNMMEATLPKARDLLCPEGGVLVILHPQGASNVLAQARSNPTMVSRGLPTTSELQLLEGFELIHAPAKAGSMAEAREGYLAVLLRRKPIMN